MISVVFTVTNAVISAQMAFRALLLYLRMTRQRRKTSNEDYRLLGAFVQAFKLCLFDR